MLDEVNDLFNLNGIIIYFSTPNIPYTIGYLKIVLIRIFQLKVSYKLFFHGVKHIIKDVNWIMNSNILMRTISIFYVPEISCFQWLFVTSFSFN